MILKCTWYPTAFALSKKYCSGKSFSFSFRPDGNDSFQTLEVQINVNRSQCKKLLRCSICLDIQILIFFFDRASCIHTYAPKFTSQSVYGVYPIFFGHNFVEPKFYSLQKKYRSSVPTTTFRNKAINQIYYHYLYGLSICVWMCWQAKAKIRVLDNFVKLRWNQLPQNLFASFILE